MPPSPYALHTITRGMAPDSSGTLTSIITGGLHPLLYFSRKDPNALENTPLSASAAVLSKNANGTITVLHRPGEDTDINTHLGIPIGKAGVIEISDLLHLPNNKFINQYGSVVSNSNNTTYTGSDLKVIVDLVDTATTSRNIVTRKNVIECTTLTISIHREKVPVRAAGYIGVKAFARGRRTIAGTMILTQFVIDSLYSFLMGGQISGHDVSKDTYYVKPDQLPPFNMTLLFADEFGNISYRRILGVDFVTDGVVYSTNDMITEQTVSYMAADFTPLLPIIDEALFTPDHLSQIFKTENTVQAVMAKNKNKQAINPATNTLSIKIKGLGNIPFRIDL